MTQEADPAEIPVQDISDEQAQDEHIPESSSPYSQMSHDDLVQLVTTQKAKLDAYQEKLQRSLADYDNLQKKTARDIQTGVDNQLDKFLLDFISIYDDFIRAKNVFVSTGVDCSGLESILKNMDSLLTKYNVTGIDALGQIFDPNMHEAISIVQDPTLDESTITKEIRKGYISHNRVIRPSLVEISKK